MQTSAPALRQGAALCVGLHEPTGLPGVFWGVLQRSERSPGTPQLRRFNSK